MCPPCAGRRRNRIRPIPKPIAACRRYQHRRARSPRTDRGGDAPDRCAHMVIRGRVRYAQHRDWPAEGDVMANVLQLLRCRLGKHQRDRRAAWFDGSVWRSTCVGCKRPMYREFVGWGWEEHTTELQSLTRIYYTVN